MVPPRLASHCTSLSIPPALLLTPALPVDIHADDGIPCPPVTVPFMNTLDPRHTCSYRVLNRVRRFDNPSTALISIV